MIEFIEDTHTYLNEDGIIVPSVSELIRFKYPEMYQNVPKRVLKKKADYGSRAHGLVERFVKGKFTIEELRKKKIDPDLKIAVEEFENCRKMWAFHVKDMEQIVCYDNRYCGKYDILTIDNYIVDIKTTSELHEDWLRWQISLYYKAAGIKQDFGFVIWLPKGKGGVVKQVLCLPDEELEQLLKEYEKANPAS